MSSDPVLCDGNDVRILCLGSAAWVSQQGGDQENLSAVVSDLYDAGGVPELIAALTRVRDDLGGSFQKRDDSW